MAGSENQTPTPNTFVPNHQPQSRPITLIRRTSLLLCLPHDVLLCIADWLEPPWIASFALTNKALLNILGTICLKLNEEEKTAFLRLLEPEFPDLLLCRNCLKFTLRNNRKSGDFGFTDHHCFLKTKRRFDFGVEGYSLLISDVQQILNRHQYGPEFGITVDDIEYRQTGDRFPFPHAEFARARIWADRLYLRVDTRTRFDRDDESMRTTAIHCRRDFCVDVFEHNLNYYSFQEMGTPFARCSACMSEFRIKICRVNEREDELRTTAWYKLGSVNNYFGTHWSKINTWSRFEPEGISEEQAVYRLAFQRGLEKGREEGV